MPQTVEQTVEQKERSMEVAKTILTQLGGNKFIAMTGAREFVAIENGICFRFPGKTTPRVNYLKIVLQGDDTYSMEFGRVWGMKITTVKMIEGGVYFDQLQSIFTENTGLYTHL